MQTYTVLLCTKLTMKHIQQQKKSNRTLFMNSTALTSDYTFCSRVFYMRRDYSTRGGTGKLDHIQ